MEDKIQPESVEEMQPALTEEMKELEMEHIESEQKLRKYILWLQSLVTIACMVSGLLAGGNVYRYIIEVPAWLKLNKIMVWGEYSRYADLGNGLFLFPVEAIISAVLLIISSILIRKKNELFVPLEIPLHSATVFAIGGLVFTLIAAPYMLSVRTMADDAELLQHTFNRFHLFGFFRAVSQVLSFFACTIALGRIYGIRQTKGSQPVID